jgi:hypothetical protein
MLRYKLGFALLACAAFAIGAVNQAQAATVVNWNGDDSFTTDQITFTGFTANQLSSISGDGTYTSSSFFNFLTFSQQSVDTTFSLALRLNGIWTTVSTWTLNSLSDANLSSITTPINFASSTVSGIELTATPNLSGDNYDNMNFNRQRNQESFTFNSVTATPLPGALPLLASGLGALGLLGWRRRRKACSMIA